MRSRPALVPLMFATVPAAIALIATLNLTVPYFLFLPGPTTDVSPIISVDGAPNHEVNGALLLTTVRVRSLSTCGTTVRACFPLGELLVGYADGDIDVVPRGALILPGESEKEADERSEQEMDRSQLVAAAAALSHLGYEVTAPRGVEIIEVRHGVPAQSVLQPGDVLVGVSDGRLCSVGDLTSAVTRAGIGAEITLDVLRGGEQRTVSTRTVPHPDDPNRAAIGVVVEDPSGEIRLPLDIRIGTSDIGGPSAGLMFALGVVDLLTEEDLVRGRVVAGTGSIAAAGCVGAVGGIKQKLLGARADGAELFLVPPGELAAACRVAGAIPVISVDTLAAAVDGLRGEPLSDCGGGMPPEAGGREG